MKELDERFLGPLEPAILSGRCNVAVDIGANAGQWTSWLCRNFTHVLAVEPDRRAFAKLLETSPANAELLHAACSNVAGEVELHMREKCDQTSILPIHPIGAGDQDPAPVVEKTFVQSVTMDGIRQSCLELFDAKEIDFIKLDIEGAEHLAMAGATPDLFRSTRWLVEIHDNRAAVGEQIRRLGHEDIRLCRHPYPNAHPQHMWVLFNAQS